MRGSRGQSWRMMGFRRGKTVEKGTLDAANGQQLVHTKRVATKGKRKNQRLPKSGGKKELGRWETGQVGDKRRRHEYKERTKQKRRHDVNQYSTRKKRGRKAGIDRSSDARSKDQVNSR